MTDCVVTPEGLSDTKHGGGGVLDRETDCVITPEGSHKELILSGLSVQSRILT